jgi:hypothetical protein
VASHDAWALVCRLFAGGTPVFRRALSPREIAACVPLGTAVKPTVVDQRFVLCPYCQLQSGQVCGDDQGGRVCQCPECGPVPVGADDLAALVLDESWLRAKLRLALAINSRDGVDGLGAGVWRLGEARRAPVLLARSLGRLWGEPALVDRVRVPGATIRVIAPRARETRGAPFGPGIAWLPLEERFAFYGGGIAFIPSVDSPDLGAAADPTAPVFGPFSADFRWVTLADWTQGQIRCTPAQAAVFRALWSFRGEPMPAERVMGSAGLKSDKPSDVFKVKARDRGRPEAEGPLFAYRALVTTRQREGLYWMPCAAGQ